MILKWLLHQLEDFDKNQQESISYMTFTIESIVNVIIGCHLYVMHLLDL